MYWIQGPGCPGYPGCPGCPGCPGSPRVKNGRFCQLRLDWTTPAEFNLSYIYGCLLFLERRVETSPFILVMYRVSQKSLPLQNTFKKGAKINILNSKIQQHYDGWPWEHRKCGSAWKIWSLLVVFCWPSHAFRSSFSGTGILDVKLVSLSRFCLSSYQRFSTGIRSDLLSGHMAYSLGTSGPSSRAITESWGLFAAMLRRFKRKR